MIAMKSRTLANSVTSLRGVPSGPLKGFKETAAESSSDCPLGVVRSSWRNERKFAVSLSEMVLQPTPWRLGYSQLLDDELINEQSRLAQLVAAGGPLKHNSNNRTYSKSIPSRLYFSAVLIMAFTNAVRFSAEPTLDENNTEPVHPPIESEAFTPYESC